MDFLDVILCLLALAGACLFLQTWVGLPDGLAPLAALSVVVLALALGGMAGALAATAWGLYAVCLLLGAAALVRQKKKGPQQKKRPEITPAGLLFWGGAAFFALRLAVLQPEMSIYDEYSFWGLAVKLTKLNGVLYTECPTDMPWQITQLPAIPLVGYWVQLFGRYAAWKAMLGCDLLILAGLAAVLACAEQRKLRVALPAAVVLLLAPFALTLSSHTATLCTAWMEVMGDFPSGVLFGAAVAYWLALRRQCPKLWWLALPVFCLAGNVKANTFVLALAAAGIAAADELLFCTQKTERLPARAAKAAALLAAPLAQYLLWGRYTAALVAQNAGDTSRPLGEVVVNGILLLLGRDAAPYYTQRRQLLAEYLQSMNTLFFTGRVSLLGTGAALTLLILLMFVAAALAENRGGRLRCAVAGVCSLACFGGYQLMLLLSYAFVFKDSGPAAPVGYVRYEQSYYVGWFLLALGVLLHSLAQSRHAAAGRGCALALAAVFAAATLLNVEPQFTVLGANRGQYAGVRAQRESIQQLVAGLQPEDQVFLVWQGDDGFWWFFCQEALLPGTLVYGAGGGTYGLPELEAGQRYYQPMTEAEFAAMLAQSDTDYLLVAQSDETFAASYGSLFADGLQAAANGPALYRVISAGAGYEPAAEGAGA